MPVPDELSWEEAGGFPEVFTTAHDALFTQAGLGPGERVCVHGAAGGVGTAGVQLAAAAGAAGGRHRAAGGPPGRRRALGDRHHRRRPRGLRSARALRRDPRADRRLRTWRAMSPAWPHAGASPSSGSAAGAMAELNLGALMAVRGTIYVLDAADPSPRSQGRRRPPGRSPRAPARFWRRGCGCPVQATYALEDAAGRLSAVRRGRQIRQDRSRDLTLTLRCRSRSVPRSFSINSSETHSLLPAEGRIVAPWWMWPRPMAPASSWWTTRRTSPTCSAPPCVTSASPSSRPAPDVRRWPKRPSSAPNWSCSTSCCPTSTGSRSAGASATAACSCPCCS